jgi:hypothetical protein
MRLSGLALFDDRNLKRYEWVGSRRGLFRPFPDSFRDLMRWRCCSRLCLVLLTARPANMRLIGIGTTGKIAANMTRELNLGLGRCFPWVLAAYLVAGQFRVAHGQELSSAHAAATDELNLGSDESFESFDKEQGARNAHRMRNAGLIVAGSSYGLSAFMATAVLVSPKIMDRFMGSGTDSSNSEASSRHFLPLYVPLAGPIWSLAYSDVHSQTGNVFWLAILGVGQFVGTGLYMYGVYETPAPKPTHAMSLRISVLPLILSPNARGLGAVGTF